MPNLPGAIDLRDGALGRMLARRWSLGTIRDIRQVFRQGVSADEFATQFFAVVARAVPDGVPATRESYDAGTPLDRAALAALTPETLDAMASAYLEEAAPSMVPRLESDRQREAPNPDSSDAPRLPGDNPGTYRSGERPTERLLQLVTASSQTVGESWRKMAQHLGGLNIGDDLKRAFGRTSLLARDLDDALAKARVPVFTSDISRTNAEFSELKLPLSPVVETNRQLAELSGTVRELVDIGRLQSELAQALREISQLALQQAIQSGEEANQATRQARNSVRVALATIVISILISLISIWDNHRLNDASDRRFNGFLCGISGQVRNLKTQVRADPVAKTASGSIPASSATTKSASR
jgi:hypothetical protein